MDLAARGNGGVEYLFFLGGDEDEDDMFRGLFKGFEEDGEGCF